MTSRLTPALVALALSAIFQTSAGPAQSQTPTTVVASGALRLLPLPLRASRLGGELDTRIMPVFVSARDASQPATLQLSFMNALTVLPELSRIRISINDVPVGERLLTATERPETLIVEVPRGLLEPGFNAVRISVDQSHRLDCSRSGSYELWTQILPEQSGLQFASGPGEIRDIRELAATPVSRTGRVSLRLRTRPDADAATMTLFARMAQAAVLAGRFDKTDIEINPDPGLDPGIDLVVVQGLEGARQPFAVSHDLRTDRVTLTVSGANERDLEASLANLEQRIAALRPTGSAAGLRALDAANGVRLDGGETLPLSALGLSTVRFSGRYMRQSVKVQMPADFLPGDYGRMIMKLDGAYAANLASTSAISVRVNGTVVGSLPLARHRGDVFSKRAAYLPLTAFKPGVNAIEIEAETTDEGETRCLAAQQNTSRERLLLMQTGELEVPRLARIATFPSLSGVLAGALQAVSPEGRLTVFMPRPSAELARSTVALVAKMTSVTGRISPLTLKYQKPDGSVPHPLTIGGFRDVPAATLSAAGVEPGDLNRVWSLSSDLGTPMRFASLAAPRAAAVTASDAPSFVLPVAGSGELVGPREGPLMAPGATIARFSATSSGLIEQALTATGLRGYSNAMDKPSPSRLLTPASSLLISQDADRTGLDTSWKLLPQIASSTVITGPTNALIEASLREMLAADLWQDLVGQAGVFNRPTASLRSLAAEPRDYVVTEELMPGNARLIVAGWMSRNVPVYIGLLAILAVLLAAALQACVRHAGVKA